jgi:hypothetical protein
MKSSMAADRVNVNGFECRLYRKWRRGSYLHKADSFRLAPGMVQVYVKFEGGNPADIRDEALFGLEQSGGDAAHAYLDRLLSRR